MTGEGEHEVTEIAGKKTTLQLLERGRLKVETLTRRVCFV